MNKFLALLVGAAFLGTGLFLFNYVSVHQNILIQNATNHENHLAEVKRSSSDSQKIENLAASDHHPKTHLYELDVENPPPLKISFPECSPQLASLSFEPEHLKLTSLEKKAFQAFDTAALTIPPFLAVGVEVPSLPDPVENEFYKEFGELAGSEHFDIKVEYAPKRTRPGYVFKITFIPRENVSFKRIRQNYFFLVDRSNSIPRSRYFMNKKAVAEALELLQNKDTFNILIFDDKIVKFRDHNVPFTEENVRLAKEFLEFQPHGGHFAATELYASLAKIIPQDVSDKEVNTAILFSDGDSYLSPEKQGMKIGGFSNRNNGKVALYSIASGTGNNLPLLELLSALNKGQLVYAPNHTLIGERLKQLIQTIQHPIGKHMVATAICADKQTTVLLQPKRSQLPDLYKNHSFSIYGSTNRLTDFVLFLQGNYYDRRFDIKKKIDFTKATAIGSPAIERGWTQLLTQEFYQHFFEDGKISHLETAKQLLQPLNLPVPFID